MFRNGLAALVFSVGALAAGNAAAVAIISGPGNGSCVLGANSPSPGSTCILQAITPHPVWKANNPNGLGAVWVSYADTGSPGRVSPPSGNQPVMRVTETFSFGAGGGLLSFDIWADDTAKLVLDGTVIKAPTFTLDNACAGGAIGCEAHENYRISDLYLGAGSHSIDMYVWQLGGGPFGLLYSGTAASIKVPVPATLALFAIGLLGMGLRRRTGRPVGG